MSDERVLREWIEESVDQGATTVEEIHRSIAELPLTVLERLGLFEATARDVRQVQEVSIGAVYDLIRKVNHEVSRLAGDLLEAPEATADEDPEPAPTS
jgi:phosphopentomutase